MTDRVDELRKKALAAEQQFIAWSNVNVYGQPPEERYKIDAAYRKAVEACAKAFAEYRDALKQS